MSSLTRSPSRRQTPMDPRDVSGSDSVGVVTITPRGIVVHANEAFLTMVGQPRESLPLRLDKLTPLEWQPWDRACLANLVLSRRPCWYHKEFVDAAGRLIPALVILSFGFRADQGFVATVVDLRASAGEPAFPGTSPLLQIALDTEGTIHSINPAGAEQLGYAVDELVGQSGRLVFDEADWRAILEELRIPARRGGSCREGWSRRRRRDGSILPVCEQVRVCRTADGRQLAQFVSSATGNPEATARTILDCQNRIQMLTAELSEIKAHERERLSIGLHDEVAQPLAIAKMKLRALEPSLSAFDHDRIGSIIGSVDQAIEATRTLTMELNTRMLAGPGLSVALRRLGERLMAEAGVDFEFQSEIVSLQADQETGLLLFRAVRELLYNVVKHSGASRATLTIAARADAVQIEVQDNGRGFASTGVRPEFGRPGAFGLRSVHDQLAQVDGTTEIFTVAGQGARVVLTVPSLQRAVHTL